MRIPAARRGVHALPDNNQLIIDKLKVDKYFNDSVSIFIYFKRFYADNRHKYHAGYNMKRLLLTTAIIVLLPCCYVLPAHSWIYVNTSYAPSVPTSGILSTIYDLDRIVTKNFRNYPGAFALANVGGYPIGDAYIGNFPHLFFGVSATIGCANMKYYDEDVPREKSVYPAYAPNPVLYLGFGLAGGFDLIFKLMVFTDAIYRPPLDQESAKLGKFNIYSAGAKIRKNLIEKKTILANIFDFGGFTVSAGADYMEGLLSIDGHYRYTLNNIYINPPGGYYNVNFDAYYNFNLKWLMFSVNAQALAYLKLLWAFDLYAGFGASLTYGVNSLDGSGIGPITSTALPGYGEYLFAMVSYKYRPRVFMGLFIAGLEINIWILKLNFETMVNISNGRDISLQLGTRFQF